MTIAKKVEEFEEKMRDYQNFVDQFEVMDKYQDDTEMYRKALERDRAIIGEKWKGILTWLETSLREHGESEYKRGVQEAGKRCNFPECPCESHLGNHS